MATLDFSQTNLQKLITHKVGNKQREEELTLSDSLTKYNEETTDFILKYFLYPFKNEELFNFHHTDGLQSNEVYKYVSNIFDSRGDFPTNTQEIAKILYEFSDHPNIKEGNLNVAFFNDAIIGGEIVDAIGIFKSETTVPFLSMSEKETGFVLDHQFGFEIKGIDKACIIFNTNQQNGFIVMAIDNTNKSKGAQFWRDEFLNLKPINNEYRMTAQLLNITKDFASQQFVEEFDADKTEQIDLMNRSVKYFKTHDSYDKEEFEEEVLKDEKVIKSFRSFDDGYRAENDVELYDSFEISPQAVSKQARIFKSVLKLDKDFHIYIHGDREKIQKGVETNGRKYYKFYYENEA
ncbi:MAG: nucleoid-associated protein [Melioribacteraceae bacterium]|nr:nucleoid-associated protein [Melioribacteraceae bacterium]